jgi:urea transport system permease protein
VVASKFGRVLTAIRDAESRVMFSGYNPLDYKLFAWTLSATLCGLAGALYVPQVGIINPSEMQPSNSIEMAIWVAVGGRGTLVGPLIGATLINAAKSIFTVQRPGAWLYVLGGLFVGVTLFLPRGIMGLSDLIKRRKPSAPKAAAVDPAADPLPPAAGRANS